MDKIDFVIMWVDGSDPEWLAEKNKYSPKKTDYSNSINRYRDWDNLQYWFRGVDKFAPWVNNIYFVTWGHLPPWLNTDHPKLKIVKHEDFIPKQFLPTFSANPIELNLHRIEGLSETFVFFNDDMFLTDNVVPEDFFINGVPRDSYVESLIAPVSSMGITHMKLNMTDRINQSFDKRRVHRELRSKIYNPKYGLQNFITLYFTPFPYYTGFRNPHIAISHLKSTYETVWAKYETVLEETCSNRFRGLNDVTNWLFRYWNLCSGKFIPRELSFGRYFEAGKDTKRICEAIKSKKYKTICINDMNQSFDFEAAKQEINAAFQVILPKVSAFEKKNKTSL